jgi:hypothetical protein
MLRRPSHPEEPSSRLGIVREGGRLIFRTPSSGVGDAAVFTNSAAMSRSLLFLCVDTLTRARKACSASWHPSLRRGSPEHPGTAAERLFRLRDCPFRYAGPPGDRERYSQYIGYGAGQVMELSVDPYKGRDVMATSEPSNRPSKRDHRPSTTAHIEFRNDQGTYSGIGTRGRRWRITPTFTGWRLEFWDPGDKRATYAGTHRTVALAQSEASR